MYDFSGHYSQRAHQTQRSGPLPGSTPHLNEIDEMMRQNARVHDSLSRLKEVVLTQQAALAERSKEQLLKAAMEHDAAGDDNKIGGFAGADPKKRRGVCSLVLDGDLRLLTELQKAAAPGRCHSCNRAETPEWRRGPDGARTLCNACGLRKWRRIRFFSCPILTLLRLRQVDAENGRKGRSYRFQLET